MIPSAKPGSQTIKIGTGEMLSSLITDTRIGNERMTKPTAARADEMSDLMDHLGFVSDAS
jgi:hypothetical protein